MPIRKAVIKKTKIENDDKDGEKGLWKGKEDRHYGIPYSIPQKTKTDVL